MHHLNYNHSNRAWDITVVLTCISLMTAHHSCPKHIPLLYCSVRFGIKKWNLCSQGAGVYSFLVMFFTSFRYESNSSFEKWVENYFPLFSFWLSLSVDWIYSPNYLSCAYLSSVHHLWWISLPSFVCFN